MLYDLGDVFQLETYTEFFSAQSVQFFHGEAKYTVGGSHLGSLHFTALQMGFLGRLGLLHDPSWTAF